MNPRVVGLALAAALAGCARIGDPTPPGWLTGAAWDVETAAALTPAADPFAAALQAGYVRLARAELVDHDWTDSAVYVARARESAEGAAPAPRDPPDPGMAGALAPLTGYLGAPGAMLRAGRQIGEAQVDWDCWVGETLEELGRQDIAKLEACRENYGALLELIRDLAALPGDLVVVLPEEGKIGGLVLEQDGRTVSLDRPWAGAATGAELGALPVAESEIREAFGDALAARPKPPVEFELLFDFNSARIGAAERAAIAAIAAEVRSRAAAEVLVTGHADAPGSTAQNLAISRQRAASVRRAVLDDLGRGPAPAFSVTARGEAEPAIATPAVERRNRRVLVTVR